MSQRRQKTFQWSRQESWERVLLRLLADRIDDNVVAEVRRINPRYLLDDGFAWLNNAVVKIHSLPLEGIPALLGSRLPGHYDSVIAFHGSRCTSPSDFLTHGIKPSDIKAFRERAMELFGDTEDVRRAMTALRNCGYESYNQGRVWLCLAKKSFLHEHKCYLRNGCEYLAGIANRVGQIGKLQSSGLPVIVECRIATSSLTPDFWQSVSRHMIEDYFSRLLRPSEKRPVYTFCIAVTQTIPPENIIRVHQFAEKRRTVRWKDAATGALRTGEHVSLRPNGGWDGIGRSHSH